MDNDIIKETELMLESKLKDILDDENGINKIAHIYNDLNSLLVDISDFLALENRGTDNQFTVEQSGKLYDQLQKYIK